MDQMWPLEGQRVSIPDVLLDEDTGKSFTNCRMCHLDLQSPPVPYMVEKVIRHNKSLNLREELFGYAICLECAEEMKGQISKESMEVIQEFISKNVDLQKRMEAIFFQRDNHVEEVLSNCMLSGQSVEAAEEYQMAALCDGDKMIVGMWPYVIDSSVIGQLTELLSPETLGNMDDFYGQNFGLPPEWADLFKERPVFWI
ncbi:MAG: hypothetical protein NWR72_15000 [Bacteroidia bacterium]|nr:hypothetical protein [Bacteroidia bacterium]